MSKQLKHELLIQTPACNGRYCAVCDAETCGVKPISPEVFNRVMQKWAQLHIDDPDFKLTSFEYLIAELGVK